MNKEQFIEMFMVTVAIEHLHIYSDKMMWDAKQEVIKFLKRTNVTLPENINLSIEFRWERDGIIVSYKYLPTGWGINDDDRLPEYRTIRYSYLEVFGWEPENWNKPFQLSEVLDVVKKGLKK